MIIKHKSQGIVWFSYEPLDNLGFLNNWTTTRTTDFAKNAGGSKSESLALANRVFAGGKKIYLPKQVHGTDIHELLGENDSTVPADAVFVKNPGLSVGVLTADCIPLILADPVQKTVCVVHAGRKGVFLNIVEKALARMNASKETAAVLGPFIRKCCYEVKEDVFENGFNDFKKYFNGGTLDMSNAVIDQLTSAGVLPKNIHDSGICTSCSVGEFFSHRKEQGKTGRFMTGVCIK